MESVMRRAQDKGRVRTLLGRRCRFNLWEPNQFGIHKALNHEDALAEHGPGIKRAFTYKALNRLIQGSAADMTKKSMVDLVTTIQTYSRYQHGTRNSDHGSEVCLYLKKV